MKLYHLENSLTVPAPLEEVWRFFANPNNLAALTPGNFKLRLMQEPTSCMFAGQEISYQLSLLPGLRIRWEGEIVEVIKNEQFIDEQRKGPFAYWRHHHTFAESGESTVIGDHLQYGLPLGRLGAIAQPLVQKKLADMFTYRNDQLKKLLT